MDAWLDWLRSFEWSRLAPELLGKTLGVVAGIAISWFLLFRKRLRYLDRLRRGDSDELLFQAHYLLPVTRADNVTRCDDVAGGDDVGHDDEAVVLLFRNVAPRRTIDDAYDNPAARETLRKLARTTTLNAPIVPTQGRMGFEILNDASSILAGYQAVSSIPRRVWLFCITCEDRTVVRKECIRCFLFHDEDLRRFADWQWCRRCVRVERPWHWLRVVTLHRIARYQHDEELALPQSPGSSVPLVDDQRQHRRITKLSLGLNEHEIMTGDPVTIDWSDKEAELARRGVDLVRSS